MSISVEKKVNNGGTFYDITVDGITIYGCKRVQKGEYDFIAMPQRKYQDKDGKDKYIGIVKVEKAVADEMLEAVKEAEGEEGPGEEDIF
jgi:DNA-binding cell septation regulator SpoVG